MLSNLLQGLKSLVLGRGANLSPEERRELIRVRCRIPVTVTDGSEARYATVTDVSLKGMRLKLQKPPRAQQFDVIHEPSQAGEFELDAVRCKVIWSRKRRFSGDTVLGLSFHEDPERLAKSWVRYILRAVGLDERAIYQRRNYIRAECSLPVDVFALEGGMRVADGSVVNLGIGGMLMQSVEELDRDFQVRVQLGPHGKLKILELEGVILERYADHEGRHFHYSVRFENSSDEQLELLGRYVIMLLRENSGLYGR